MSPDEWEESELLGHSSSSNLPFNFRGFWLGLYDLFLVTSPPPVLNIQHESEVTDLASPLRLSFSFLFFFSLKLHFEITKSPNG